MTTPYNHSFYAEQESGSRASAAAVLAEVAGVVQPKSVLDVGCGVGTWVAEWIERGIADAVGVDGDYVDLAALQMPADQFTAADLAKPLDLGRRFDLVQSLEVAEHLDAADADTLIASLVRHGDLVLFSAAIPGQSGTHHVNLQWPSYWVEKFRRHGYELFDVLRPKLWTDDRIDPWYRQNALLFATGTAAEELRALVLTSMPVLDIVHPRLHEDLLVIHGAPLYRKVGRRVLSPRVRARLDGLLRR